MRKTNISTSIKKYIFFIAILFAIGGVFITVTSSDILAEPSELISTFPSKIPISGNYLGVVDWQVSSNRSEARTKQTTWNTGKNSLNPLIIREVSTFTNSLEAKINYETDRNRLNMSSKWPNAYTPEARYLKDESQFKLLHDNSVMCEMGGADSCQRWQYLGRFGKYTIEVIYFGPNQGIDIATFRAILDSIINDLKR